MRRKLRAYIAGPLSRGDLCENVNRATAAFLALAKAGCAPMCPHWSVYAKPAARAVQAWTPNMWVYDRLQSQQHRFNDDARPVLCEATAEGNPELTLGDWMNICLPWVDVCDFLVRLPGESKGADMEVARAMERGIKVFYTLDSALQYAEVATSTFHDTKAGAQ